MFQINANLDLSFQLLSQFKRRDKVIRVVGYQQHKWMFKFHLDTACNQGGWSTYLTQLLALVLRTS